jgi:hypothetical protein
MTSSVERSRLLLGLLVGPLVVIPLTFAGYIVLNVLQVDGFRGDVSGVSSAATNFALAASIVAYAMQAVVGAPISLFLAARGRLTLSRMLVVGGLAGALPFLIAFLIALGGRREASTLVFAGIGAGLGTAIGGATYILATRRA